MAKVVTLGPNSYARCLTCGRHVTFFTGPGDAFMSEERRYPDDKVLQLSCPVHGEFSVQAGEFVNEFSTAG